MRIKKFPTPYEWEAQHAFKFDLKGQGKSVGAYKSRIRKVYFKDYKTGKLTTAGKWSAWKYFK